MMSAAQTELGTSVRFWLALLVKDQHAISVTSLLTYIVYCRTYALADQWEVAA